MRHAIKLWLRGLAAAFIAGGATIAGILVIDGKVSDYRAAAGAFLGGGVAGAILYLKQSPLPPAD